MTVLDLPASKTKKLKYGNSCVGISYKLRHGERDSIVFIHGLGANKDCYQNIWYIPEFSNYTVLTFDLPGFGDSDKPRSLSYTMEEYSDILLLLVGALNLGRFHLITHSMGGAIGLLLAQRAKSIILSLINLEGNLIGDDCTLSRDVAQYSLEDFENIAFQKLKKTILDSGELSFASYLAKSDPYAFFRSSESLVKWSDSEELLGIFLKIAIPRYYIFGQRNMNAPVIKRLDSIPMLIIPGAGHVMMIDNPADFYRVLRLIIP
jgi:pimeloyl-ACP methyl ester carboxylesterase